VYAMPTGDAKPALKAASTVVRVEPRNGHIPVKTARQVRINVRLHGCHGSPPACPQGVALQTSRHRAKASTARGRLPSVGVYGVVEGRPPAR
jgi:hypothetical protein